MKVLNYINLVLVAGLIGSGCATFSGAESPQNVSQMKTGMSQTEILSLLGMPDSIVSAGLQDRWIYEYKQSEKKGHNLFVDFKSGSLVKAGELSSRDLAAAEENRVSGYCTRKQNKEVMQESLCIR